MFFSYNKLKQQQILFDGVRYSIFMVEIAYQRLLFELEKISDIRGEISQKKFIEIFIDVWTIVDSGYRLRKLIAALPGIQQKSTVMKDFMDSTNDLKDIRDFIQHSNKKTEVENLLQKTIPFWGYLTWVRMYSPNFFRLCVLKPGLALEKENVPMENPLGKIIKAPIGLLNLYCSGIKLDLDLIVGVILQIKEEVKNTLGLKEGFVLPGSMADIFISSDLSVDGEPAIKERNFLNKLRTLIYKLIKKVF